MTQAVPLLGLAVALYALVTAFTSVYRVLTRHPLLPFDQFANLRRIRALDRPLLVIHGTADGVVPFSHGRALFDAAPGPKRKLWVDGAGHNDLAWVAGAAEVEPPPEPTRCVLVGRDPTRFRLPEP